ncbi:hypothetical protein HYW58_01220 [Candidatus Kaiserbacteria bacterium]|nr:hypothetical protein [Candidatus Kaiserbacteria bacterium]
MKNQMKDGWDIFDFTDAEAKTVHALKERGALSVSALSRVVNFPRSTVDDVLKRLHDRKMVRRVSKGYASVWRLTKPTQFEQELKEAAESLGVLSSVEKSKRDMRDLFGVRISEKSEVKIYRGVGNVVKVYLNSMARKDTGRIYAIQTASAALSWFEKVPGEITKKVNEGIKKSGVILEGVLTEDIKDVYRKFAEKDPDWPKAFGERMQAIRLVPKEWLKGNMEFFIFKNMAVMNNWTENMILTIEDENVASFLKSLYTFLYEAGKPFDQNEFVRGLIK